MRRKIMVANKKDDFDVSKQLEEVSNQINQPDKFANIFCDAAKSQVIIGETVNGMIIKLLNTNHNARQAVTELLKTEDAKKVLKQIIREVDKEDWRNIVKKIGLKMWGVIAFITGAISIKIIDKIFSN